MSFKKVRVNVGCLASPRVGRFLTRGTILSVDSKEYAQLLADGVEVSEDPNSDARLIAIAEPVKEASEPKAEKAEAPAVSDSEVRPEKVEEPKPKPKKKSKKTKSKG